jgi:hypothetical protein
VIERVYLAAPGSHLTDDDATRIGRFLDKRFGDSKRTPEDVVAAARPKRSPIHRDFEWDDAAAATEYRLAQARYLLRSIQVTFRNERDEPQEPTRAFHSITYVTAGGTTGRAYLPARVVWAQPELAEQVRERARQRLQAFAAQFRQYEFLSKEVAVVDALVADLVADRE